MAAIAAPARADTTFESKIQVYSDNDHTTVVSPLVQASADVTPDTSVTLGYVADIVTSASVDLVSQASPTTIHDTRHQVSTGLSHTLGSVKLHGNYSFSRENDYLSHTIAVGGEKELFDKNTTIGVGYAISLNTVGRADDLNFSRSLNVQTTSLSWTQIVTPRVLTQVTYELGDAAGFQSSPYRFVPVRANLTAAPSSCGSPRPILISGGVTRSCSASIERSARRARSRRTTASITTPGASRVTRSARATSRTSRPDLELRLRNRFYTQDAASFYLDNYTAPQRYMTYDRELSPLWSETVGAKLSYLVTPHVEVELKCDVFYFSYADFAPLKSRTGENIGTGLALTY